MNALELADTLECLSRATPYKRCGEAAAMLRKQADEIERLRKDAAAYHAIMAELDMKMKMFK